MFEQAGVRVVADSVSMEFLRGAVIDFTTDLIRSGFEVCSQACMLHEGICIVACALLWVVTHTCQGLPFIEKHKSDCYRMTNSVADFGPTCMCVSCRTADQPSSIIIAF